MEKPEFVRDRTLICEGLKKQTTFCKRAFAVPTLLLSTFGPVADLVDPVTTVSTLSQRRGGSQAPLRRSVWFRVLRQVRAVADLGQTDRSLPDAHIPRDVRDPLSGIDAPQVFECLRRWVVRWRLHDATARRRASLDWAWVRGMARNCSDRCSPAPLPRVGRSKP